MPNKYVKKYHIVKKKKSEIWKLLDRIEKSNMKKFQTSYVSGAVYKDMLNRCIICSSKIEDLIFKKRFDKMIKKYRVGKVFSPFDFKVETFNPLAHIFVKGQISEC